MEEKLSDNPELLLSDVASIGLDTLLPVIQRSPAGQITGIVDWKRAQLSGGVGGGAIYRFSGQGRDKDQPVNWSVILKILKPAGNNLHISDWNYYRREVDAYCSGWLNGIHSGIAAPRYLGIHDHPDGTCWLWLEDIQDCISQWTLEDYGCVARNIGHFNGAYLTGTPMPQQPWLSSNWIRGYINLSAPAMEPLRTSLDHPLVRRWFPGRTSDNLFRLWDQREVYFNVMDHLPQTMCHFDMFRRNLFLRENVDCHDRVVAIDWAFAGPGCVGADISPLMMASLAFFEVGLDKARELDQIIFNEYLEGLQQAGWKGDPRQVRLGYLIANMRYSFAQIGDWLRGIFDDNVRDFIEQAFGHPLGEIFDYFAMLENAVSYLEEERGKLMDGWV